MRILDSDWRSAVPDWELPSFMPADHEQHLPQRSCFQLDSTGISKRDTVVRIGPGAPAAVVGPSAAAPYIRSSPAILNLGAISGQTMARRKTNHIQRVHCKCVLTRTPTNWGWDATGSRRAGGLEEPRGRRDHPWRSSRPRENACFQLGFNNSLYSNTVKTDGSCTSDVAVYYNTKQYSTIQYNT